jgi:hypothetical protein
MTQRQIKPQGLTRPMTISSCYGRGRIQYWTPRELLFRIQKYLAAISQMVNTDNEQALIYLEFQRAFNGNASG